MEYVGWVENILELNYKVLNTIVLLCNWVKVNYVASSTIVKQNEYGFTLVNFASIIPISNQSFGFPLHVDQIFFPSDPKERGWKIILWKEPYGRHVIDNVQIDLREFDMFKLQNDDAYAGLQAPITIDESIQLVVIVGGSTIVVEDLIHVVFNGMANDGTNNVEEYAITFNSDGQSTLLSNSTCV